MKHVLPSHEHRASRLAFIDSIQQRVDRCSGLDTVLTLSAGSFALLGSGSVPPRWIAGYRTYRAFVCKSSLQRLSDDIKLDGHEELTLSEISRDKTFALELQTGLHARGDLWAKSWSDFGSFS